MSNCKVGEGKPKDCNQIPNDTATWSITITSKQCKEHRKEPFPKVSLFPEKFSFKNQGMVGKVYCHIVETLVFKCIAKLTISSNRCLVLFDLFITLFCLSSDCL